MSCNCSKCNNQPCGCQDSSLNTPCSYTECSQGTQCSEVICEECVIHCGETYTFCYGEILLQQYELQLTTVTEQIEVITANVKELIATLQSVQAQYDKQCGA
jgi:hypothetical protein